MLRVKLLAHSSNASTSYGLLASCTKGSSARVIMNLAVWLTIMLKIAAPRERHQTFTTAEAFVVPLAL